jgi:hypothetical protein
MNSNHVMPAKDLASTLGVSEMDLQHLAHERRLPFFVSGAGGFAIMPAISASGARLYSRRLAAANSYAQARQGRTRLDQRDR